MWSAAAGGSCVVDGRIVGAHSGFTLQSARSHSGLLNDVDQSSRAIGRMLKFRDFT